MFKGHLYIFYVKYLFMSSAYFSIRFPSPLMSTVLYILRMFNPLYLKYFANIFSHFVICILFVLKVGSFVGLFVILFAMPKVCM